MPRTLHAPALQHGVPTERVIDSEQNSEDATRTSAILERGSGSGQPYPVLQDLIHVVGAIEP